MVFRSSNKVLFLLKMIIVILTLMEIHGIKALNLRPYGEMSKATTKAFHMGGCDLIFYDKEPQFSVGTLQCVSFEEKQVTFHDIDTTDVSKHYIYPGDDKFFRMVIYTNGTFSLLEYIFEYNIEEDLTTKKEITQRNIIGGTPKGKIKLTDDQHSFLVKETVIQPDDLTSTQETIVPPPQLFIQRNKRISYWDPDENEWTSFKRLSQKISYFSLIVNPITHKDNIIAITENGGIFVMDPDGNGSVVSESDFTGSPKALRVFGTNNAAILTEEQIGAFSFNGTDITSKVFLSHNIQSNMYPLWSLLNPSEEKSNHFSLNTRTESSMVYSYDPLVNEGEEEGGDLNLLETLPVSENNLSRIIPHETRSLGLVLYRTVNNVGSFGSSLEMVKEIISEGDGEGSVSESIFLNISKNETIPCVGWFNVSSPVSLDAMMTVDSISTNDPEDRLGGNYWKYHGEDCRLEWYRGYLMDNRTTVTLLVNGTIRINSCSFDESQSENVFLLNDTGEYCEYMLLEYPFATYNNIESCIEGKYGCDGMPGSNMVFDECGVCGGAGSTCIEPPSPSPTISESGSPSNTQIPTSVVTPSSSSMIPLSPSRSQSLSSSSSSSQSVSPSSSQSVSPSRSQSLSSSPSSSKRPSVSPSSSRVPPTPTRSACNGVIDNNGICTLFDCEGTLGGSVEKDICGICGGDGSSCVDCDGTVNGNKVYDSCGVCGGTDDCVDCLGVIGGTATTDLCDVCLGLNECFDCNGVKNGPSLEDLCGVCDGSNACVDCMGITNGIFTVDVCGVCGGNILNIEQCAVVIPSNGSSPLILPPKKNLVLVLCLYLILGIFS